MATFVLVHGAWHGGWCWQRVVPILEAEGHQVLTPTLSGLGERAAELSPDVGLSTHAADIAAVLATAPEPVVLVGHSYSGLVVRQAADAEPGSVARIVLLDAWFGPDGTSLLDLAPDWFRDAMGQLAASGGDEASVPPPPAELVGVTDPDDQRWLEQSLTPQPALTFSEPTVLTGAVDAIPTTAVVVEPSVLPFRERAEAAGYPTAVVATGHDLMVTEPERLAQLLLVEHPLE